MNVQPSTFSSTASALRQQVRLDPLITQPQTQNPEVLHAAQIREFHFPNEAKHTKKTALEIADTRIKRINF